MQKETQTWKIPGIPKTVKTSEIWGFSFFFVRTRQKLITFDSNGTQERHPFESFLGWFADIEHPKKNSEHAKLKRTFHNKIFLRTHDEQKQNMQNVNTTRTKKKTKNLKKKKITKKCEMNHVFQVMFLHLLEVDS